MSETPSVSTPPEVLVTLLLEGGQSYAFKVPTNNQLLQQLFETVVDRTEKRAQRVFQIPVNEGKGMLCFPSDRLVGVVTEPPLVIQQQSQTQAAAPAITDSLLPGLG